METTQQQVPYIIRGRVEMRVPQEQGEITYIYPANGPGNYQTVGKDILEKGLAVPTGDYTAPLLHAAYCSKAQKEPELKNVRDVVKNNWLWVFNHNLFTAH